MVKNNRAKYVMNQLNIIYAILFDTEQNVITHEQALGKDTFDKILDNINIEKGRVIEYQMITPSKDYSNNIQYNNLILKIDELRNNVLKMKDNVNLMISVLDEDPIISAIKRNNEKADERPSLNFDGIRHE